MIKRIIMLLAILVATSACATVPVHTNTGNFNATNAATGNYNAFAWEWMGYDDQAVNVNLLPSGSAKVWMRMSYPRRGTVFLDVTNGVLNVTNLTFTISRTNLPPDGIYFAEFMGFDNSYTNTPTRTLATGKINIQHSIYQNTNQASWINPLAGTLIGPPIHTLTDLSNWPFELKGGGGTGAVDYAAVTGIVTALSYPLASNPSNYCILSAAASLTNSLVSYSAMNAATNALYGSLTNQAGVSYPDAPTNGTPYARQDGSWVSIPTNGGSTNVDLSAYATTGYVVAAVAPYLTTQSFNSQIGRYASTDVVSSISSRVLVIENWTSGVAMASALGSAAYSDSNSFASASDGTLARSALQSFTESDPVWGGVSNVVRAGAALGATAIQGWSGLLNGSQSALSNMGSVVCMWEQMGVTNTIGLGVKNIDAALHLNSYGGMNGDDDISLSVESAYSGIVGYRSALKLTSTRGTTVTTTIMPWYRESGQTAQAGDSLMLSSSGIWFPSASGITNISVNGTTGTVVDGVASVTIAAGGVSAPSTWDMSLTWGGLAQATTNDSVGIVDGQLSGQSVYNASNTIRYASFCTSLTNTTSATASTAFTLPLGYGGTGAVVYVKQSQTNNSPIIFRLNDEANTLSVTANVSSVDTETAINFEWPAWATNAGAVIGLQAIISGASTNVASVRYWGVNRKLRLQK